MAAHLGNRWREARRRSLRSPPTGPARRRTALPVFHLDDIGGMADFIAAHLRLGAA